MKKFFKNKNVLITGGTGLIGFQLTELLSKFKSKITVVSLEKNPSLPKNVKFFKCDLRNFKNCLKLTKNVDYVFHLAGIKGSPKITMSNPYSFMTPMLQFNTNILEASRLNKVKRFLYTSSIGVYKPDKLMREDDVWKTFPSKFDWFSGWAKRIGELQIEALKQEKKFQMKTIIVRPANVFGPFDNFNPETAMVIPSLIHKFVYSKNRKVLVWGDGSSTRDFIFSKDVAKAMLTLMIKCPDKPINIGSGKGYKIKEVVNIINSYFDKKYKIEWDKSKPTGDKLRLLSTKNLKKYFNFNLTNLRDGIFETINWYISYGKKLKKYDVFKKKD